jgi:hypothetical protein
VPGPPWTGTGGMDNRPPGHGGALAGAGLSKAQKLTGGGQGQRGEGRVVNTLRGPPGHGRQRCSRATAVKRRRRWHSVEAALKHGEGRRRAGRGAVEDGGGSPFYRGRRG